MKRLLKVTAMTGLLTLLRMGVGFVVAKVVAVYTGPTGMAMLGQVQSMVTSLTGIINAPATAGVVRYTAEHSEYGYEACVPWWRASFQWIMILSAIIIPIGLLLSKELSVWLFQDPALSWIVVVTVCVLPLSSIGTLCNSVINGQQLYRRYVALGMLSVIISGTIMLVMVAKYNIHGALLASAIQSALIGVVMLVVNIRQPWLKVTYWWGHTDHRARKAIGGYMLMAITTALTVPVSLIIIRSILIDAVGWDSAGLWQAVWKVSEVYLGVITMALGTYYLPKLSKINGVDHIIKEINSTVLVVIPIVSIAALLVYLFRDFAISILFTNEFYLARELFLLQLTGDVIKIASWLYAYPMLSRGAVKWFVLSEIFFSILLVVLSYFLISHVGLEGAPLAYMINYIVYFLFVFFNVRKFAK
ncbi:O-antigen translocase [Vibrio alginolyticus]